MFQRSNSNSNIPLPRKGSSSRSQSTSRLSQRDSQLPVPRRSRNSSLERRSTLGLPKTTPLGKHGPARPSSSVQKTTPTFSKGGLFGRNSQSTTPRCTPRKTIQKLSMDKRWVEEQYAKVKEFIASCTLFDDNRINANNFKPFTIQSFIYISSVLLMEIFPRIKITNENFKEVIPLHLKILKYPGTLTNSVLKTVNAQHSFPQVIGMFSWLIDKVNFVRSVGDTPDLSNLDPAERQNFLLNQIVWNFMIDRYKLFNNDNNQDNEPLNRKYVRDLSETLDVDYERLEQLKADISKKERYKSEQEQEIFRLTEKKQKTLSEINQMQEEIEKFQEDDINNEHNLNSEIQHLENSLKKLRERKVMVKQNIRDLEEAIKVQSCTLEEKKRLLQQIEDVKNENLIKSEKIEHAQKIKNDFDHKLAEDINKIKLVVIQWNRSLMEISIKKPELKKLLLREKGFHDSKFLEELQEVLKYKENVEIEALNSLAKIEEDLRIQKATKQEIENEIEELSKIVENLSQEYALVNDNIEAVQMKLKEVSLEWEKKKKYYEEQLQTVKESPELAEQEDMIILMKEKQKKTGEETTKFGQKMLSFFVDMNHQVMNSLQEMDNMQRDLEKRVQEKIISQLEPVTMIAESLISVSENTKPNFIDSE